MIGVGIIGYGYWGPNLVRNFSVTPGAEVIGVSDLREARLAVARGLYPAVEVTTDAGALIRDPRIDAIVICTPVSTHFDLGMQALEAGKHVLVEKPMAATTEQCRRLVEEAKKRKVVLMVDHTFLYTGAVRKIKELVQSAEMGEIYYYDSVRVNLGLFQHDVDVLWDLAVHDLSIMDYILEARPYAVSAMGVAHVPGQPEDIAYLTVLFPGSLIAHFHVNWLAPVKLRRTLIGCSRRMIVYDDLETMEKVKVYDRGVSVNESQEGIYKLLFSYRSGDMWAPHLDTAEALRMEALHFVECIEGGRVPLTDGVSGLRVVRMLEAATDSMRRQGRLVDLGKLEV